MKLDDGTDVRILQETDYPVNGEVRITLQLSHKSRFALKLRIPAWSRNTSITVNNQTVSCEPGTYARLERDWIPGDVVVLKLDLRGRVVSAPSGAPELAVMRGPIVLALDNRLIQPQDQDVGVLLATDSNGDVELRPYADKPKEVWMAFEVPFQTRPATYVWKPTKLIMCDFASAGNSWSESNLYRVWLPQPTFLRQAFIPDTWKLMHPGVTLRPDAPTL